tara:strand:+ start:287 stop:442 length:156 start_codon:yes stop_codon:yes gene_type:complete
MAKYTVVKGFNFSEETGMRKKGQVADISGDELKFAKENDCVVKFEEKKSEK